MYQSPRLTMTGGSFALTGVRLITAVLFFFLAGVASAKSSVPEASGKRLEQHVRTLAAMDRHWTSPGLERAAHYIESQLKMIGLKPHNQIFRARERPFRNIIARLGPQSGPLVVVGAHYDTFGHLPGADDNASGVAGVLELARLLRAYESRLKVRVELAAWPLEEPPFFRTPSMGSYHHAAALMAKKVPVHSMISIEMIGYFSDAPNSQSFPIPMMQAMYPTVGRFITFVGRPQDAAVIGPMRATFKALGLIPTETVIAPASIQGIDFSDHLNFWAMGYPAMMLTDTSFFRNHHYHTSKDTPDRLDYVRMSAVVSSLAEAILRLPKHSP